MVRWGSAVQFRAGAPTPLVTFYKGTLSTLIRLPGSFLRTPLVHFRRRPVCSSLAGVHSVTLSLTLRFARRLAKPLYASHNQRVSPHSRSPSWLSPLGSTHKLSLTSCSLFPSGRLLGYAIAHPVETLKNLFWQVIVYGFSSEGQSSVLVS